MDSSQIHDARRAAQKFLNEGSYLQSLEEFSKILGNHPQDQEALEGRISACLELKLFHRCLKDIETLSEIKPCDTKVHNLAGQIYEQIGACDKSICAYLKAYLHEQQREHRLNALQKITEICPSLFEKPYVEIRDKHTDGFQTLVMLSEQFAKEEKFQICLEVIVTAIIGHCLDKSSAKAFENELDVCWEKDNIRSENVSKQLPKTSVEDSKKSVVVFERFAERVNSPRISKSETDVAEALSKSSLSNTNVKINSTTPQGKLHETASVLKSLHSSCIASEASVSEKSVDQVEHHHSLTTQTPHITVAANIDPQVVSNLFLQASECSYRLGKPETSLCFAKKLWQISQSFADTVTTLKAYTQLGFLYTKYGEPELGVLCYTKVRSKCKELLAAENTSDNEMEISAIEQENTLKLCLLLKDLEIYQDADEVLLKEFFSKVEVIEQNSLMTAYGILGEIELAQGRYMEAIRSYKTQLALCLKYNDKEGLVVTHSNLGNAYQASGNSKTAMEWFQLSLHTANTVNDPLCLATAYNCIGKGLIAQKQSRQALTYFEKQLDLSTTIDQQTLRVEALFSIGKIYQDLRLLQHSEFFLKRALLEAKDWKLPLEEIAENLVRVLGTLGKHSEALKLLYEVLDHLEFKFHRISGYKIVISHALLDKLNTCVDQVLVLIAEEGRQDEALQLAERSNCILLNQMLAYRAYVQGSETVSTNNYLDLTELYQIVRTSSKVVLYYRVVQNGFMVWIIGPEQGVVHFHWFKVPSSTPFRGMIEDLMNGLLQPKDSLSNYTCDHRKVSEDLQVNHDTPTRSKNTSQRTSRSNNTPDASTSRSKGTPQSRPISRGPTSKDFLQELSKLFIFPIEEILTSIVDMRSRDLVIVSSSFLSIIPFTALHTSNGTALADLAGSIQLLSCISVLKNVPKKEEDFRKGISIIGNPEIKFPEMHVGFQGHVQPEFLEKEVSDVAILLGTVPNVGASATKEHFLRECSSSSLIHLSTYGSHDHGTISLAPIADIDRRVVARDSWEITLEDILASRRAPEVMVLNLGYGCRNQVMDLANFGASLPLAFMLAGVKTVVMPTWSTPQNALLSCLRQFYKNISDGLTITCALSRAKTHVQEMEEFREPVYWASFNVYGRDSIINVEDLQRTVAEASFVKAQKMAVERFEFVQRNEESSGDLLSQRLMEAVIEFLHRHHQHPNLLPILLQVTHEAMTILEKPQSSTATLPYREITPPWLPLIRNAEKFLISVGFLIKTTNSRQTILVYPHWNRNDCLGKVESLLQCVLNVLTYSPALADALRAVLAQEEEKTSLSSFRDVLQQRLGCPYEIVELRKQALLRMFWLRRSTRRLMVQLGFRKIGDMLEFRNSKDDRNAVQSCLKIFTLLTGFETSTHEIQPHPMLSKANLGASWMSYQAGEEENTARYFLAKSLDSIDAKYKLAINDVRRLHNRVLLMQTKAAKSKKQTGKLDQAKIASIPIEPKETSNLPQIKTAKRQPLDLVKLGEKITKVKVKSGAGPSSVRLPVEKEYPLPLVECAVKRHEATVNFYQYLGDIRDKKHEEIRKLLSL